MKSWDPARSVRLNAALDSLAAMMREGIIAPVISPKTLCELGAEFTDLYHAAFQRSDRPAWARQSFAATQDDDSGFDALCAELSARCGFPVENRKKIMPLYQTHSRSEGRHIKELMQQYEQGAISRGDALRQLSDQQISLSASQERRYFPQTQRSPSAVQDLERRIQRLKRSLEFATPYQDCEKGFLFEGAVGCFLVHKYGRDHVAPQRRMIVQYHDLKGKAHREVFSDFIVDGTIIEVKWRNSLENILNSVLPQLSAYTDIHGVTPSAMVVSKETNHELKAMLGRNVSFTDETRRMGIENLFGKPLSINYLLFEDLIWQDEESGTFTALMQEIDALVQKGDHVRMSEYSAALRQIYLQGHSIESKVKELTRIMSEQAPLPAHRLAEQFGPITLSAQESADYKRRTSIIMKSARSRMNGLLARVYHEYTGVRIRKLDHAAIQCLMSASDEDLGNALKKVYERNDGHEPSVNINKRPYVKDFITAHEDAYKRHIQEITRKLSSVIGVLQGVNNEQIEMMRDSLADFRTSVNVIYSSLQQNNLIDMGREDFKVDWRLIGEECERTAQKVIQYIKEYDSLLVSRVELLNQEGNTRFLRINRSHRLDLMEGLETSVNQCQDALNTLKRYLSDQRCQQIFDRAAQMVDRREFQGPSSVRRIVNQLSSSARLAAVGTVPRLYEAIASGARALMSICPPQADLMFGVIRRFGAIYAVSGNSRSMLCCEADEVFTPIQVHILNMQKMHEMDGYLMIYLPDISFYPHFLRGYLDQELKEPPMRIDCPHDSVRGTFMSADINALFQETIADLDTRSVGYVVEILSGKCYFLNAYLSFKACEIKHQNNIITLPKDMESLLGIMRKLVAVGVPSARMILDHYHRIVYDAGVLAMYSETAAAEYLRGVHLETDHDPLKLHGHLVTAMKADVERFVNLAVKLGIKF
ncbi:MAG: hypothetical protein A2675_02450 [Candidatus Yonathbacteria bacterium RIFCSPHIGHO2_01_FULL_51_10]|uniref:Uncharacterized protein n=1 Tax=Candidatus Yonathbacteria bacterium RIFCSPHIGHO2_01_FULL_51_10 TaxID=1802723 RepID=A0A1G2S531_9BACT|nr:MAG: hypothetical protein A2675_02450 [Candidatus Yonathbacteria bacterium RIFCSPHIGHO2_01_FULL_51_10]